MSDPALRNIFVNRLNGTLVKIVSVDDTYAVQYSLDGRHKYSIPIGEYDTNFAKNFRPATLADMAIEEDGSFRPPANADEVWGAPRAIPKEEPVTS